MTSSTEERTDSGALRSFPGWRVVAGCFFVLLINAGLAFYGLSVYLNAFSKEQDWPIGSISFAVTIFFIVGGLFGLVAARLIARYDVRAVIIAGAVISGGALAAVGQVTSQWQLYLAYAVFAVGYALHHRPIHPAGGVTDDGARPESPRATAARRDAPGVVHRHGRVLGHQ